MDSTAEKEKRPPHTQVKGRFNQYTSAYWVLALPALGARYIARFCLKIFDHNSPNNDAEEAHDLRLQRAFNGIVAAWMFGITAFYGTRTLKDMRNVFSETLADETKKAPEDVTLFDLWKSKNTVVHTAMRNIRKYTARRALVNMGLVVPFFMTERLQKRLGYDAVDLGVGLNMGYLATDALGRKETFFEALQSFIDRKVNQKDRIGEQISGIDMANLYERYARENQDVNLTGQTNTPLWRNSQVVFERIAELMNHTYGLKEGDRADFAIPKFIGLLGNGMFNLEQPEKTLAYVEVANRYGMDAVRDVNSKVKTGIALEEALRPFPVQSPAQEGDIQKPETNYAEQFQNRQNARNIATPSGSHTERLAHELGNTAQTASIG